MICNESSSPRGRELALLPSVQSGKFESLEELFISNLVNSVD